MNRIIIDTDTGVDDAQALLMAFAHTGTQVEAITSVSGNVDVEKTTANVLKVLDVVGKDVPVFKGCALPLVAPPFHASFVHGEDGLGDCGIPTSTRKVEETHAVHALLEMAGLSKRAYGDGDFNIEYTWERKEEFVRYKVNYISDGLTIHGFVNIPEGKGPFPVIVALHGYIPASEYETLDYSTRYADSIARKGYIVLHPNLRNFPPSDSVGWQRDSLTGYTVDVLNLLAHVRGMAGQPGIFENADLSRMGIWGHSLGGGIALRVVGLVEEIKAAVLYAAVSQRYSNRNASFEVFNYQDTEATFSVHHGMDDDVISIESSEKLCLQLEDVGKAPECFFYEDQPHTFYRQGEGDALFIERTIEFLDRYLKSD